MFVETPDLPVIKGEPLEPAWVNYWRINLARAIDGTGGSNGTPYTPSTPIIIGGSGIVLDGSGTIALGSRSVTRVCDVSTPFLEDPSDWTGLGGMRIQSAATGAAAEYAIHVPNGATLTEIAVLVDNPSHGGSWPPVNATRFELYRTNLATGTTSVAGPFADSTANQATYESLHWLTSSTLSITIDRTTARYTVRVVGESGTNALSGVVVHPAIRVIYTPTSYDED